VLLNLLTFTGFGTVNWPQVKSAEQFGRLISFHAKPRFAATPIFLELRWSSREEEQES
jgi:hypothetical protein